MENAHYFLHVTDTHLCFDAEAPDICCTEQALRSLYQTAFAWDHRPAFVLITGDLVHEGTSADYARAKTLLQELDACCAGYPGGAEALAGHAAAVMLDGLATHMEKDPRWGKRTRDNVFFDTKVALAIFFTPLLRKLQLELAEPLRTQLQTQWLARWPKQLWRPGDYDTLAGGFKKFRFCFITTATCAAEGKPDDCAELTAFRAFRDGWLRQRPDGPERIAEYYAIAPSIVAGVEYCDDAPARYAEIRARWLGPCYAALQRGEMERCYDTYRDMVQTLQERYGVQ